MKSKHVTWRDGACLCKSTLSQQKACVALTDPGIFQALAEYDPVLAGAIPLGLAVAGSGSFCGLIGADAQLSR